MKFKFKNLSPILVGFLTIIMILSSSIQTVEAAKYANSTQSIVLVNGIPINFEAYNIDGNNYFKIRDVAQTLSQTNSKFNVKWDPSKNAINLITGSEYQPVGGEMEKSNIIQVKIVKNTSPIYKNNKLLNISSYNIGGNNYFKLRDIAREIGFNVSYDSGSKSVLINTGNIPLPSPPDKPVNKPDEKPIKNNNLLDNLHEYDLSIEYNYDKDIEYEYKNYGGTNNKAKYENEVSNTRLYGAEAEKLIKEKLLNLDYSLPKDQVIDNVLSSLGLDKNYREFDLEIEYNQGPKLKIKDYK